VEDIVSLVAVGKLGVGVDDLVLASKAILRLPILCLSGNLRSSRDSILRMKKGSYISVKTKWENLPDRHDFESPLRSSKNQRKLSFIFYFLRYSYISFVDKIRCR